VLVLDAVDGVGDGVGIDLPAGRSGVDLVARQIVEVRRDRVRPVGDDDAWMRRGEGCQFGIHPVDPVARRESGDEHERTVGADRVVHLLQFVRADRPVRAESHDDVVAQGARRCE